MSSQTLRHQTHHTVTHPDKHKAMRRVFRLCKWEKSVFKVGCFGGKRPPRRQEVKVQYQLAMKWYRGWRRMCCSFFPTTPLLSRWEHFPQLLCRGDADDGALLTFPSCLRLKILWAFFVDVVFLISFFQPFISLWGHGPASTNGATALHLGTTIVEDETGTVPNWGVYCWEI